MSKVLESLVARGRRVRNFRETREVTFGLADLSTHPDVHERLVKKGGIETLVNILITAQDAEAQQFAALAVANTAATKTLCNDIVKLDGVIAGLVQYVGNEQADAIGRQYSAMAIGNILAEPATHEVTVEAGCIDALITMMTNCVDARELESGKYAAFAVANIASNCQYHKQLVEGGSIELLVALACCEDPDTQRQSLAAVRGLCTTSANRQTVLQKGILDPLILMSRSDDIDIVREVSSALNCLSSEEENKEEISYRAISTLISLLMSGDGEVERHSCCAIANLVEVTDIHSRFLEERGVAPLISLCSSPDGPCRIEASRAVANLSSNHELIDILINEKALGPLVKSIEQDGNNCRFAALAIANFATHAPSLFKIVQAGAVPQLVALVAGPDNHLECRRYGALALSNMTACEAFHATVLDDEGPEALFALSNSYDDLESRRFVSCALANLSANTANHERIVEMGGLQPTIALAYDSDQIVHKQAVAALRGFSATGNNTKIVHEGGLEPLCRLLLSEDFDVLRETTACMCNLSLADESKFEITKSGAVSPLVSLIQSEDLTIAHYACECLANLAEMTDNQGFIAREGSCTLNDLDAENPTPSNSSIEACISAMRSRNINVQREAGRLLANLSGNVFAADQIISRSGHELLTSFLLSQDTNCQRVGAFGIGNLCTHEQHRRTLMTTGVLEPLSSLARSGKVEIEIRRFSMRAIANLASCYANHDDFVSQNTVPMLVSFSNSSDPEIRNYAAFAVAELSRNSDMMGVVTDEGGLEPVLYLARSDDKKVQRQVLPALTTLSFLDCNKVAICTNGALPPIVDCISERRNSVEESQLACCAIANLLEAASNMSLVVNHGCIPLLVNALDSQSDSVQREAARAIGNLAVNTDLCDLVIQQGAAKRLVVCFQSRMCECQRMAAMALSNLSSNLKSHSALLELDILSLIKTECLASLDPKRFSDHETARFCVLIISNMTGGKQNHGQMDSFFDILMDFTRHRDVKCRQHAVLAIGNLCTNPLHIERLLEVKCTDALIAFAFPPTTEDSVNAQYQAIAGLRGISKHETLRVPLLREGALEPLIIGTKGNNRFSCVETQREAAATLANLALAEANRFLIAKSGALPALVNLMKNPDSTCQVHAGTALANLAESSGEVHELLLTEQCLEPMCLLIQEKSTHVDVKRAVSRCIALLASNGETHIHLLQTSVINPMTVLTAEGDTLCERFGALTIANLSLCKANHSFLLKNVCVESLLPLTHSDDIETLRGVSFALHSLSIHEENHSLLEGTAAIKALVTLARCGDRDTALQACLATKYLCVCERCRNIFVESRGLEPLLLLASSDDLETKQEVCAALRNISLSDQNKVAILKEGGGGVEILAKLARDEDPEVAHQAIGVLANVAESHENKMVMVEQGIIHHLQYSILSKSIPVLRESIRTFANLSSARDNTQSIISSGALSRLVEALGSTDTLSRRFSTMALSNLASSDESKVRIVREHGVLPLMSIVRQTDRNQIDTQTQQQAMACLASLVSCHELHGELLDNGCAELSMNYIKTSDLDLRRSALLCISNFASNNKSHSRLGSLSLFEIIKNLDCNDRLVQLRAVTSLRGLSTDPSFRERIISSGALDPLLSFVHKDDTELKMEVLSTLCNLSLGGFMGDNADTLLKNVDMQSLLSFLCNSDSTHRLFGAVAIGNIASHLDLQEPVLKGGALQPLIGLSDNSTSDVESQRCVAYAICNLSSDHPNRMSIILNGGLASIMFLCHTGDTADMLAALSTLRGLAASAEARRPIVEEGVLCVLALAAVKTDCLECKREASAILVLLSLNEQNKFDIVRSQEMKKFVTLTGTDDVECVSQMVRTLGTISECAELHEEILQVFPVEELVNLSSPCSDPIVVIEVSRLYANLASNFNIHASIVKPQLVNNVGALCSHAANADIRRFSSLALANLCLNVKTHSTLPTEDLVSILNNLINEDLPVGIIDEESLHKYKETKCHACVAISALATNPTTAVHIIEVGTVLPALLKMFQVDEGESSLNLHLAFVLNKLTKSANVDLSQHKVATCLTNYTHEGNVHALTYSIAALRRLCDDKDIRVELIAANAVEFMAKHCDLNNTERCREIASAICHLALWDEARAHIINSDIFHHILEMTKSSDEETSRFSIGALGNIADDSRFHDTVAEREGVVSTLLALTQNATLSVMRESSRALSNVLSSLAAQDIVLKEDEGMVSLVNVSKIQDYECVYNAAVAFRKLSANSQSHEVFFSQNREGIHAVVDLATHDEREVQLQSAAALRDISSNPDFKVKLAEMGGIRTAIELASLADIDLKVIAFGIIRHLSIPMQLKRQLADSGIVDIMTDCVNNVQMKREDDLMYQIASSIANMAEHGLNKVVLVKVGVLHCLILLSKQENIHVKRETSRACSLLSSAPENNVGVFDTTVIPSILDLLSCEDKETARDAAATISNVATSPEINQLIGSHLGGIEPLVILLTSPYESCQKNSCRALCRLTTNIDENKVSVISLGGLSNLIRLCSSSNQEVVLMSTMVLCNLSTCSEHQMKFVEENGLPTLNQHMSSDCPLTRKNVTMILCNLTCHDAIQDHVAQQIGFSGLFELMNDVNLDCRAFATMIICNLASKQTHGNTILDGGGLQPLATMVNTTDGTNLQRAALLTLYNLSACESSHPLLVEKNVVHEIVSSINNSEDVLCRRFSLMILANVACNDKTRTHAIKGGGLQAAVVSLKDEDFSSRRFACICLANMSSGDPNTQSQIVVHGALPSLVTLCLVDDDETQDCAFSCLSNVASNESNHTQLMKSGAFKAFVLAAASSKPKNDGNILSTFGIANMTSNGEILSQIGRGGGIKPLVALAQGTENLHSQCLALSSLRRLAFVRENRDKMMAEGIVETLRLASKTAELEIQREVASTFCVLSLCSSHHVVIAQSAMSELLVLTQSDDLETIRLSLGALANLAEGIETHSYMTRISNTIVGCLERDELDIKREAARVISNLLSSCEVHPHIIKRGLDSLILLSANSCNECRYLTALSFRKLSSTLSSHHMLINDGLQNILALIKVQNGKTRKHAATALRDLCASSGENDNILFFKLGVPGAMVDLVKENDRDVQIVAVATLRHLSSSDRIKDGFSTSGIMQSVIRCISRANEDMRCQIAGLFANLSEHRECHPTIVANGIVQAVDSLTSIEHDEIWQDCSRTLANLCCNENKQASIHGQGCLSTLARLSKSKNVVCQRYVAIALRFMSSSVEVQRFLHDDKSSYFPFIEFSSSNLLDFQRAAAAAFASMSLNHTGKLLVLQKGGIKSIVQLCINVDLTVRRDAVFSIANFAASPDFCQYVVKEGGVETIKVVASTYLASVDEIEVLRDTSRALSSLSTDAATKEIMVSQEIPKVLCKLAKSPDSATQRYASLALCNLCSGTREQKELVVKQGVLRVLLFLLRFPDLEVERCAMLAIAALSLGSDRNKAEVIDNGFVRPLIDSITYPDMRLRQSALLALNGIALGELPETKECILKEDGLSSILDLIKSDKNVSETTHAGLYLLATLAENTQIRDALVAMDCLPMIVDGSTTQSIEIKRAAAYFLSLLSECPEYHNGLQHVGGLESIVALASLVDEECQDYGAFTLAFLANNKSFQVPLVKMGAVRPLVSMMETSSQARHFAALALLKLADNFENHVQIASEGGINALLKLGRSKVSCDNMRYSASLTVSRMAKNIE